MITNGNQDIYPIVYDGIHKQYARMKLIARVLQIKQRHPEGADLERILVFVSPNPDQTPNVEQLSSGIPEVIRPEVKEKIKKLNINNENIYFLD